jgi:hypothetical protein
MDASSTDEGEEGRKLEEDEESSRRLGYQAAVPFRERGGFRCGTGGRETERCSISGLKDVLPNGFGPSPALGFYENRLPCR